MKKLLKIFLLAFFLLSNHSLISQPSITWEKIYNNIGTRWDGFSDICLADSGNYFLAGHTLIQGYGYKIWVIKINEYGDTIWTRALPENGSLAYAVTSSGDGGCVLTGGPGQAFCIKLDKDGNTIWRRFYGGSGVQCRKIIRTSDRGYIACGRINLQDGYVLKIDVQGMLQWQKTYPANYYKYLYGIIQSGQNYYYTGVVREYPQDTTKTLFTKLNQEGEIINERIIKVQNRPTTGYKILKRNNNFILSGSTPNETATATSMFFANVDTSGNILYAKIFSSPYSNSFADMKILKENRFVIASSILIGTALNGRAIITDSLGNIIYEKLFTLSDYMDWNAILPADNGDLIITGLADLGKPFEEEQGYAVRTDSTLFFKPSSVINSNSKIVNDFELYQNYPNPFNPSTTINYELPNAGSVKIIVYDISGKKVKTLINEFRQAGSYNVIFDGKNLASGVYFYKLVVSGANLLGSNNFEQTRRMVLIK